ncbi:hypothetical protein [Cellulosimicrobium arenosum]|uniref:DUF2238 domain-containing protein n=1 Tax=Cellulosimicrobium arenosum TaxID=2708133 RepID=A0A927G7B3_9MICO|nr:hypothetical protein [Cellulosimicrobium arenosum]MBD8077772.1 hypothetical protein [Cellulosimicrobium arenosum]
MARSTGPSGLRARLGGFVPGDVVRVAALVSVVVAFLALGGVAAALFLLVLGGVVIPRALGAPTVLDVAYGLALLVAAWAAQLDWYRALPWLDLPVHAACTGLIAVMSVVLVVRRGVVPGPEVAASGGPRLATVVLTTGLGAVVAILWEIGEWAGHTYLDDRIGVGYTDTVVDLAAGLVGSALAGLVLTTRPPAGGRR